MQAMQATSTAMTDALTLGAVGVKIPRLCKANPKAWFRAADVQFGLAGIVKESTKLSHMIAIMDTTEQQEYDDLIEQCLAMCGDPAASPYAEFKTRMIKTATKGYMRLYNETLEYRMGDRRPQAVLQDLLSLWADGASHAKASAMFKACFVSKLLVAVRTNILSRGNALPLAEAVEIAEAQMEDTSALGASVGLHALALDPSPVEDDDALLLAALRARTKTRGRRGTPGSPKPPPFDNSTFKAVNGRLLCAYHAKLTPRSASSPSPARSPAAPRTAAAASTASPSPTTA